MGWGGVTTAAGTYAEFSELLFFVCASSCTTEEKQEQDLVSGWDVSPEFQPAFTVQTVLSFSHTIKQTKSQCTETNFHHFFVSE